MENIVSKEHMDALKALSDVNIKISDAKNVLFKLQEEETKYLITREQKALDRIKQTVADSQHLVQEADTNYSQIKALLSGISDFVNKLTETQEVFHSMLETFNERNELWEKNIGQQQDSVADMRKGLKIHSQIIENDKKNLELSRKNLNDQRKHIESQQAALAKSYEAEKQLWEKLSKN